MVAQLLAVENLTVERGGRIVLLDLAFTLAPGETLLVAGRNGAGKSTLLRTLAGLLQPAAGRVVYGLADDERRGVETLHYLGYEDALKPSLTVRENLEFWAAMLAAPLPLAGRGEGWGSPAQSEPSTEKRTHAPHPRPFPQEPAPGCAQARPGWGGEFTSSIEASLAAYGVERLIDLPAAYLSAGQKRRVALARLLIAPRPVWLLDEPLIALDMAAQARTTEIMAAHTAAGGAILVASHQPLEATRRIELDRVQALA